MRAYPYAAICQYLRLASTPAVSTPGMAAAEMQGIAAIIAGVRRATAPTKTASGKPSLANYTVEEGTRAQAEERARDLLGRFPLYPEIEL
jgi:glycine hydroxymethyltransferase